MTLAESMVANSLDCRMEAELLAVGSKYAVCRDRHTWWLPGGESFVSERTDVLCERDGKISAGYVLVP